MSDTTQTVLSPAPIRPVWRDYLELTKPGVVLLLMVTAVIGMFLATNPPGMVPLAILLPASIGMAFAMAASAIVNHVVDRRIDLLMARTQNRPVATGRISDSNALIFACVLCAVSVVVLYTMVNTLTAGLTVFGIVGYAFIYTLYLKRATHQNIVIGGLAGALPPLLGWTSVTNNIHPHALLLVLIIYVWTPPHFWALAIHRREDYAKAGLPMLPVTHGNDITKTSVLMYTVLLLIVSLLPYLTQMFGWVYLLGSLILGLIFIVYAWRLKFSAQPQLAMKTFGYSITYLFLLFALMLFDHYLPLMLR